MKKAWNVIKNVLVWLLFALVVFMMVFTVFSVATFDRQDRSLFGLKFFVVQTDSMKATDFKAGDLIVSKEVDPKTLKEGDVITFISMNPSSKGEVITHKIKELTKVEYVDKEGKKRYAPAFTTYGTTTGSVDETAVEYGCVIGKYQGKIPNLGKIFVFLKTPPGYFVCIFVPIVLIILFNLINLFILIEKRRKQNNEVLEEERRQIEDERRKSREMMDELESLKAQMEMKNNGGADVPPGTPEDGAGNPEENAASKERQ